MIKRMMYMAYYFKELDWPKLDLFIEYVSENFKVSKLNLWLAMLKASLKYNISFLDYFYFKFFSRSEEEKRSYAGTGYMYEYQLVMNPKKQRQVLENKFLFLKHYKDFIFHKYCSKSEFLSNSKIADELITNEAGHLVLKSSDGQCGEGIEVLNTKKMTLEQIKKKISKSENDLIEEFIVQHDALMKLSPAGLNTVRIFTQLDKNDQVCILGARLRITINSVIDNLAAGNIAAPINERNGLIEGPGVYSDITKKDEYLHPITGVEIVGFKVPFWDEALKMVKDAALLHKENRSIGWDIAITNKGPELLEGNHNWCKLLWQLPVKQGLKVELEKFL